MYGNQIKENRNSISHGVLCRSCCCCKNSSQKRIANRAIVETGLTRIKNFVSMCTCWNKCGKKEQAYCFCALMHYGWASTCAGSRFYMESELMSHVKRDIFHEWIRYECNTLVFCFYIIQLTGVVIVDTSITDKITVVLSIRCLPFPFNHLHVDGEDALPKIQQHRQKCDKRDPINSSRKIIKRFMLHRAVDIRVVVSHFNEYVSDYEGWRQK